MVHALKLVHSCHRILGQVVVPLSRNMCQGLTCLLMKPAAMPLAGFSAFACMKIFFANCNLETRCETSCITSSFCELDFNLEEQVGGIPRTCSNKPAPRSLCCCAPPCSCTNAQPRIAMHSYALTGLPVKIRDAESIFYTYVFVIIYLNNLVACRTAMWSAARANVTRPALSLTGELFQLKSL